MQQCDLRKATFPWSRSPSVYKNWIKLPRTRAGNPLVLGLVCKGFNADFDGDQMAVHLPLSIEAQVEATVLMMSTNNIFSPANGQPIISPSQDIVMGCYYLTAARGMERGAAAVDRYEPAGSLKQVRFPLDEPCEDGEGMIFSNIGEVFTAYGQKKLGVHARIQVRLPIEKKVISEVRTDKGMKVEEVARKPNGLVTTTVGRVLFNDILNAKMAYYDVSLTSKELTSIIVDCDRLLGRRETIDLLDRMKELGFRESTRSGLSFAMDDLKTPGNKEGVLMHASKEVDRYLRQYADGNITELERYNKVIDLWTHARDEITKAMMEDLKNDRRDNKPYLNPVYLMAYSGARGSVEQIRQLCGMRGLMAKPNGTIIETPIKANFREGLSVLEYFSSTHGARKGLADTALNTADSGYLTRKLADVAQNVVVTMHDCETNQGVSKSPVYKGDEIERPLSESIRGRVSRNSLIDPVTNEEVIKENEMITVEKAREIERMGLDKILVRSPMTCKASLGVCRLCYGMDLATGALVEEGMAVGIIAAQSIGEPGTQLTMRTFHIGGVVKRDVGDSEAKCKKAGTIRYERINDVINDKGERIALSSGTGEIAVLGPKDRVLETFSVPNGSVLMVPSGATVQPNTVLIKWDPHITPIITDKGGKVRLVEIVEGQTLRKDRDESTGAERWVIMEHKGDLHPRIELEDEQGKIVGTFYMPERAFLEVRENTQGVPRHAAGEDAAGSVGHAGHHRRSAASDGDLRGAHAARAGQDGRGAGRRAAGRTEARQADDLHPADRRARPQDRRGGRAHRPAGQARPRGQRRPGEGGRPPGVRSADPARDPRHLGHRGGAELPGAGGAAGLSQPARGDRRQAHRDHRRADAAQGAGAEDGRHRALARQRDRQVHVPGGQRPAEGVREDQDGRRLEVRGRQGGQQGGAGGRAGASGGGGQDAADVGEAAAGQRQGAVAGHHQGGGAVRFVHQRRVVPGDDEGADGGGAGGQGGLPGGPEGERHPGPSDPGRHRLPHAPGGRGAGQHSRGKPGRVQPR